MPGLSLAMAQQAVNDVLTKQRGAFAGAARERTTMSNLKATAKITTDAESISVTAIWSGAEIDRPDVGGWGLGLNHRSLAERLARAIDAQAAFEAPALRTDINGHTYVEARRRVMGRTMNADLKRLGF